MAETIKIKKGFDINLAGKAEKTIGGEIHSETYAIKPTDFIALEKIKLLVRVGDVIKAGTPLFFDKEMPQVQFVAPVSGEVIEVKRGAKRKLLEVRILADATLEFEEFKKYTISELSSLSREDVITQMCQGGIWPSLIQRPYAIVANPEDKPKSIFISTFDSSPLAADYDYMLKGQEKYFQAGVDLLNKVSNGPVHLNIDGGAELSKVFSQTKNAQINKFQGPHPAGNVGVQIHHVDPINKGDLVWTINPFAVAQLGKLFLDGVYDASKVIAVAGSEINKPQYFKTYAGVHAGKLLEGQLKSDNVRVISGNVLTGENIGKDGYLGFYDSLITVIPEGNQMRFVLTEGWMAPTTKLSFHRALGLFSFLSPKKEHVLDTNTNGEVRAFVMTGAFEKVVPMDVLPTHLVKSILANDYDEMEALGIYEVAEEDLALCEFIDVSKHDIQALVRKGLDMMRQG